MNAEEGLKTPSKVHRPGSASSPSTRSASKKGVKNAKITNFFTKVNSPSAKNNSNSNHDHSENDQITDDLSKDDSSSLKMPTSSDEITKKDPNKEYVFIVPSSDDDTNASTRGSAGRRRRPPSVHSNNSRSSDGLILTNTNNELGVGRRRRAVNSNPNINQTISENVGVNSCSPRGNSSTPTRSSGRDSRSRDSLPDKKIRLDTNQSSAQKIVRIQPTMIGCRTKSVDFQSVPSDLNMPRDQAFEMIEKLFFVKMPEDFFLFWEFAKTINHRKPCSAFSQQYLEWKLVGPFDVLSGLITTFHGFKEDDLLTHCRYFYDPPEFQTVIAKRDSSLLHYGYYRDDINQERPIVASNRAAHGGQFIESGDNLFTLLKNELDMLIGSMSKSSQEIPAFCSSSSTNPQSKSNESDTKQTQLEKAKARQELTILRDKLIEFCSYYTSVTCDSWSVTNNRRNRRCAKTLNTMGFVVPVESDISYKDLGFTENKLHTMLARISELTDDEEKTNSAAHTQLQHLVAKVKSMNDRRGFALGLLLGLDLFYHGDTFLHNHIETLLTHANTSISGRSKFIGILKAHLAVRNRGDRVSLLD